MIGRQKISLVFTNQLRQKMGVMFGDPWTTSGGKVLHSIVLLESDLKIWVRLKPKLMVKIELLELR